MKISTSKEKNIVKIIQAGGVGVLPTDTLYGLVGSAMKKKTVERIYQLRKRNSQKPMVILIGSENDLNLFGISRVCPRSDLGQTLKKVWPGEVSVILPLAKASQKKFWYLHRGVGSLAFRLPKLQWLRDLLKKTGPLVAPSCNFEGEKPAETIGEAKKYFGANVDFYVSAGKRLLGLASTLIAIEKGKVIVKREGKVKMLKLKC